MLPTMSWLVIVVLLVVFVVRMWLSMVTRRRQGASVEARVPAQRTPPAPVQQPSTAGPQPSGALAASVGDVPGPVMQAPQPAVHVGAELEGRVRALMSSGFEAGAVRLLCDELGIGIHDAQQTVRALTGHPRADAASQDSASR
jgi:hypothetical protein